jgi:hypothetical protein
LKKYRSKKYEGFQTNNYIVALFDSDGTQIETFDEITDHDFMSTLALTGMSENKILPAGKYTVVVLCQ